MSTEVVTDSREADGITRGADYLVHTLIANGVESCFANPGTSEMHFVAALDKATRMQCVLSLFEGCVTGAADGYFRIKGKPAATLLHLGPGLANGLANLHNAKKARSGVVNIVGEHATDHLKLDAPLTSDIEALARPMSSWVKTSRSTDELANDVPKAVSIANGAPAGVATLVLPADVAWSSYVGAGSLRRTVQAPEQRGPDTQAVVNAARSIREHASETLILLGGKAVLQTSTLWASRIEQKFGVNVMAEFYAERLERGAGRASFPRLPYSPTAAIETLKKYRYIVLVCAREPVSFFGYPGLPGRMASPECQMISLADHDQNPAQILQSLAEELGAQTVAPRVVERSSYPMAVSEQLTVQNVGLMLSELLPDNAIVVDEAISSGRALDGLTRCAAPHDWLTNMGGSIGFGLPVAVGAAIAAPQRRVVVLEGDGSAMYTVQSLWSMARESLNITVVIYSNRKYQILLGEYEAVGGKTLGNRASSLLTIGNPALDWPAMAKAHGIAGVRVESSSDFRREFVRSTGRAGPTLIEVVLP